MVNLEERVALAKDVKRFAVEELGISPNPSFERVEEDEKKSEFYGIYCSYRDRIESAAGEYGFIICGNHTEWQNKSVELEKADFDTHAVTWEALSTEDCPMTKSLLESPDERLAYVILHENSHIQHNAHKFSLPYNFDEALATCFGFKGTELYFGARMPKVTEKVIKDRDFIISFFDKINYYLNFADEAYKKSFEEGRAVLEEMDKDIRRYCKYPKKQLNNAFLLSHSYYADKTKIVWERLKDIHPKEYMTNKDLLYEKLKHLLPPKAE